VCIKAWEGKLCTTIESFRHCLTYCVYFSTEYEYIQYVFRPKCLFSRCVNVLRVSKYVFSPTITVVTKDVTVILTATESDYERSMAQHDLWYNCLNKKLDFGSIVIFVFTVGLHSVSGSVLSVLCCAGSVSVLWLFRVTTCLENLEMSRNLKHVRGISGKKSCQGKVSQNSLLLVEYSLRSQTCTPILLNLRCQ